VVPSGGSTKTVARNATGVGVLVAPTRLSKERAAKIANSPGASKRGGKKSGGGKKKSS
jgi:hypothetical protein